MYESNSITALNGTISASEVKAARSVVSVQESEQTEKTLHHLAGRVEELRARLERVLTPAMNGAGGNSAMAQQGESAVSPLSQRLKSFRKLAQSSVDTIEDILNRLDV